MIGIEKPLYFLLLIPVTFAALYSSLNYIHMKTVLKEKNTINKKMASYYRLKRSFLFRTIFRILSALSFITALSGVSCGTDYVPVQKNGRAVSMVFDISYSMMAKDSPGGITRLESAKYYAGELLDHLDGQKISLVIAKGEGTVAVPMTDDFYSVRTLIDCLSPDLMSAGGTSIAKGIYAAMDSFPKQSSELCTIWVFTDCEETDSMLQSALNEITRTGVQVVFVGFGSERETEVFAGDNKTKVKTALRSVEIQKIIKNLSRQKRFRQNVIYIDASEVGSATKLLSMLNLKSGNSIVTYETQIAKRHVLFISFAVLFFIISVIFGEFDYLVFKKKSMLSILLCTVIFTGCSSKITNGNKILKGNMNWKKEKYQSAVAEFLSVSYSAIQTGDKECAEYSVYNLGTTYLMQGEHDACIKRYESISNTQDTKLLFSIMYNQGIICHRNGEYEKASDYFRKALMYDRSSVNARINLELSQRDEVKNATESVRELTGISINHDEAVLQSELYSIIREEESKQWKNRSTDSVSGEYDY